VNVHLNSTMPRCAGMNVQTAKIGGLNVKMWDVGGQTQFRSEWSRYAQGCACIVFVVDTHDTDRIVLARHELHILLEEHLGLANTPILVLANKIDLQPHLSEIELVEALNLDYVTGTRRNLSTRNIVSHF